MIQNTLYAALFAAVSVAGSWSTAQYLRCSTAESRARSTQLVLRECEGIASEFEEANAATKVASMEPLDSSALLAAFAKWCDQVSECDSSSLVVSELRKTSRDREMSQLIVLGGATLEQCDLLLKLLSNAGHRYGVSSGRILAISGPPERKVPDRELWEMSLEVNIEAIEPVLRQSTVSCLDRRAVQ